MLYPLTDAQVDEIEVELARRRLSEGQSDALAAASPSAS